MNAKFEIAMLVGSLRSASLTRKIAHAMIPLAPPSLHSRLIEIGDLPLYNEDLEANIPASWSRLRSEISASQAAIFLTPEYNRSVPACLKNAIDVGTRPPAQNVWNGKPAAVVGVTPYKLGAFGANLAVRQCLIFPNMPTMQQPEAYISNATDLFNEDGSLKDEDTKLFLTKFMTAFEQWVIKFAN
jgi:chromate reductase